MRVVNLLMGLVVVLALVAGCGGGGGGGTATPPVPPAPVLPSFPDLPKRTTAYSPSGRLYEEGYVTGTPELRTGIWKVWSDSTPPVLLATRTYVNGVWDQSLPWFVWDELGVPVDDWTQDPEVEPPTAPTGSDPYVINSNGDIDTAAYNAWAVDVSDAGRDRRLGPDHADFPHTGETAPGTIYQRHDDGRYVWKTDGINPVDYSGMAGQVLYVPDPGLPADSPARFGMDRMRFLNSYHQGHGGAQFWHVYETAPSITYIQTSRPDTSVLPNRDNGASPPGNPWITAVGGQENLKRPVAVARARVAWSNCGVVVWSNGFVGASGYGNNEDRYPFLQLPANKVPTAVAVTPNNEFAFITVWDTSGVPKGQVAVVALEARALIHHSFPYAGLPNAGTYTRMKLLGFIDLPGSLKAPTAIAATLDASHWAGLDQNYADPAHGLLDSQSVRDLWNAGVGNKYISARTGFLVVASRGENRVTFIDLEPLITYYRQMYFTTQANFNETKNEGAAASQWPHTFTHRSQQVPTVHSTIVVPQPSAVWCGFDIQPSTTSGFRDNAYIGTVDGRLLIYDAGHLAVAGTGGSGPTALGGVRVGRNPCFITSGGRHIPNDQRHEVLVVSRGDRSLTWVAAYDGHSHVRKILRDTRLVDPVAVDLIDNRGAFVALVSDHAGGKLVAYLDSPIKSWEQYLFGGLGVDGNALFECAATFVVPGKPFQTSAAEVN